MLEKNRKEHTETLPTQLLWHEPGVTFDPDTTIIQGVYQDELSAFRAKGIWEESLETYFLLENRTDFLINTIQHPQGRLFMLRCHFVTACARYAFWRLTNSQAPETQYILETAHIPICESRHDDILSVPDMRPINESNRPKALLDIDSFVDSSSRAQWIKLKGLVAALIEKFKNNK